MIKKTHTFLLMLAVVVLLASCAKDNQEGGFNGTGDPRDNYAGSWNCVANSKNFGLQSYVITISKSTSDNVNILMKNFDNMGITTTTLGEVSGNSLNIFSQTVSGNQIQGTGVLTTSNKLELEYTSYDGITTDSVTATCTKQ